MTTVEPIASPYLVPDDASFRVADAPTAPPDDAPGKGDLKDAREDAVDELAELQRVLYAHDRYALLLVFQAMDAAGKDSTIRKVMSGVNPAGCEVYGFKQPSKLELDHDFLWRTAKRMPQRGHIGVFNRSYYEEVLVVRVHPEYLAGQRLPAHDSLDDLWRQRLASIREHEAHLVRNGTHILKFFLNVSRDEQRRRFIDRLDVPHKNWKFNAADVEERQHWDAYMHAYEQALRATSTREAPWYAIPADDKPFMRATVADIVVRKLQSLGLHYPEIDDAERARFDAMRTQLESE